MTTELQFVELDERVYKYIRQFTIKSTEDALIELVTNAHDAYVKGAINNNRLIEIEYKSPGILRVFDNAIGLTGQDMHDCFLQVGKYTNTEEARGFFSRGAKDISAIGDIYFDTVKDDKYSQCFLNRDAYGQMTIVDQPVTSEIRDKFKIPGNGLSVTINLLPNFYVANPSDEAESTSKLGVLRDIMMDRNNEVYYSHIAENDAVMFRRRLLYDNPPGELLLDLTYNVPGYTDATARFVVYKANIAIPQPKKENEMAFGFLLKSNTTIYEVSTIDSRFRWNPYMNRVYGYLECNKIHDLLISYDRDGSSAENPMPIIDPSRLTGLNREHPFIDGLLSVPKVRLDQILTELNQQLSQQSISLKEVDQLLDELAKYGLDIVEHEEIQVSFTPNYESELAKAVEDDRANHVTTEVNYLFTNNFNVTQTELDRYVSEKIVRLEPEPGSTFIVDPNNELIQIFGWDPSDPLNSVKNILEAQPTDVQDGFAQQPYVYKLSSEGQVTKLYLFEKGVFEDVTNPEDSYVQVKNRKFQISFINDINLKSRYLIEYGNGVHIKLNIANEQVKKYLMTQNVQEGVDDLSIENVNSSLSLIFLENLMTEILAEVIVENDITNGKLILDGDNFTNVKKINVYKNEIVTRLEIPMDKIFDKYRTANRTVKNDNLVAIIDQIGATVWQYLDLNTTAQELFTLREDLVTKLSQYLE